MHGAFLFTRLAWTIFNIRGDLIETAGLTITVRDGESKQWVVTTSNAENQKAVQQRGVQAAQRRELRQQKVTGAPYGQEQEIGELVDILQAILGPENGAVYVDGYMTIMPRRQLLVEFPPAPEEESESPPS